MDRPSDSPDRTRMLDHLRARATTLSPTAIRARFRTAVTELETAIAGVTEAEARRHPLAGEWSIAEVVDHLAQTTIRSADELRHLLAGRRPPAPPVYEALASGAAARVPWDELRDGLRSANDELDALLASTADAAPTAGPAGDAAPTGPPTVRQTVQTILVVNRTPPDGGGEPEIFAAELDWKEYALVQRLHLLDHRSQVRKLRAALES